VKDTGVVCISVSEKGGRGKKHLQDWQQAMEKAGVSRNDREAVRWCFERFHKGI